MHVRDYIEKTASTRWFRELQQAVDMAAKGKAADANRARFKAQQIASMAGKKRNAFVSTHGEPTTLPSTMINLKSGLHDATGRPSNSTRHNSLPPPSRTLLNDKIHPATKAQLIPQSPQLQKKFEVVQSAKAKAQPAVPMQETRLPVPAMLGRGRSAQPAALKNANQAVNAQPIALKQFNKQASTAWKRNFTEGIRDRLVDSGTLNYAKELDGLNLGSLNMADRFGYKIMNAKKNKKAVDTMLSRSGLLTENAKLNNNVVGKLTARRRVKNDAYSMVPNSKIILRPEHGGERGMPKKFTPIDKAYNDALSLRHEVDEARVYDHATEKHKVTSLLGMPIGYMGGLTTRVSSHASPEVLFRESANMAIAPQKVKDHFSKYRNFIPSERQLFNDGDAYATHAVFDKKQSSAAVKKQDHKYHAAHPDKPSWFDKIYPDLN